MLTRENLLNAMSLGRSSGRLNRLSRATRALLYAALKYTEHGNVIKSPYVLRCLNPIIEFLKEGLDTRPKTGSKSEINIEDKRSEGEGIRYAARTGCLSPNSLVLKEQIFDLLERLRRRPDARRKVSLVTRRFLELVVRAPVKFRSQKLLSMVVKAIKEVKEALSPGLRLLKLGMAEAWRASMTAQRWGNEKALEWRRDRGFAAYWGAMIQNWPRYLPAPSSTVSP